MASSFLSYSLSDICWTCDSENVSCPVVVGALLEVLPTAFAASAEVEDLRRIPLSALYRSIARAAAFASELFL